MRRQAKLSRSMSLSQFDNGYWYAEELQQFAEELGIVAAKKLRKDELESAIKEVLTTGAAPRPPRRSLSRTGPKDVERGLTRALPVRLFTNDTETKAFLDREAEKIAPGLKRRSGVRYRFNRWREEQLAKGVALTYGDLVDQYVRMNQSNEPFERVAHGRYINFISDFLKSEKGATRTKAIEAWKKLKTLDVPKDYRSWVSAQSKRSKPHA
jgi:hypothetical protein